MVNKLADWVLFCVVLKQDPSPPHNSDNKSKASPLEKEKVSS